MAQGHDRVPTTTRYGPAKKPAWLLSVLSLDPRQCRVDDVILAAGDTVLCQPHGLINGQLAPAAAVGLFKSVVSLFLVGTAYYLAYRFTDRRIF